MSVFALLIKYLFIVFILVAFFVIGVVAYFLHRVRNAARRFANGGMGGGRSSAANNGTYRLGFFVVLIYVFFCKQYWQQR